MTTGAGAAAAAGERLAIVHVTTFYPPENFGGDGIHVQRLARAQAARGHRVTVIHAPAAYRMLAPGSGVGTAGDPRDDGVEIRAVGGGAGLEPLLVHQLGRPVLSRARLDEWLEDPGSGPPDVIHYHNISLIGGPAVLEMGRAVKLYTCHEYWLVCPTHMLFRFDREICRERTCLRCTLHARRPPQPWRATGALDRGLAHVDRMIFPSELTRRVYREQGVDVPGRVMPHFLARDYVATATALGTRSAGAPDYVLYVGRLDRVKGIEELLEAFAQRSGGSELWVAGDGPLGPSLRTRYGDHPRIRLLGQIGARELGPLYRDARVLVLPSAGYEVFGQVVVEAFAHGTPALVSANGGARELVEPGPSGVVYGSIEELHAALDRFALDDPWRDRLGAHGRQWVRSELGEEIYMDRYEELVGECAS